MLHESPLKQHETVQSSSRAPKALQFRFDSCDAQLSITAPRRFTGHYTGKAAPIGLRVVLNTSMEVRFPQIIECNDLIRFQWDPIMLRICWIVFWSLLGFETVNRCVLGEFRASCSTPNPLPCWRHPESWGTWQEGWRLRGGAARSWRLCHPSAEAAMLNPLWVKCRSKQGLDTLS